MVTPVNPPPLVKIPDKFFNDPELRAFFELLKQILFQLWRRSGGSTDVVDETEQVLTSTGSKVARNAAKINALEKISFDIEIIAAGETTFTTSRNQILICNNTNLLTVTLDPNAIEEDDVHIKRNAGLIKVVGSIDGKTFKMINIKYYSMHLVFDGTNWAQI